jgi:3'(2'), 5'-bisphosphate nucleotidase
VVESRSHPSPKLEAFLASLGPVERVRLGSSLKFCRIAEGAADIYPRFGRTMEWDTAAGDCLIRNARPGDGVVCAAYNQPSLSIPHFVIGARALCARAAAGVA